MGAEGNGRRVTLTLSPQAESLPEGGFSSLALAVSLSAHTCDLRFVMRRRLMCVHPLSSWSAAARRNVHNIRAYVYARLLNTAVFRTMQSHHTCIH